MYSKIPNFYRECCSYMEPVMFSSLDFKKTLFFMHRTNGIVTSSVESDAQSCYCMQISFSSLPLEH